MNSLLKIGDKVKIREDINSGDQYDMCSFVREMEKYRGMIATIEHVQPPSNRYGARYRINSDGGAWTWVKEFFITDRSINLDDLRKYLKEYDPSFKVEINKEQMDYLVDLITNTSYGDRYLSAKVKDDLSEQYGCRASITTEMTSLAGITVKIKQKNNNGYYITFEDPNETYSDKVKHIINQGYLWSLDCFELLDTKTNSIQLDIYRYLASLKGNNLPSEDACVVDICLDIIKNSIE